MKFWGSIPQTCRIKKNRRLLRASIETIQQTLLLAQRKYIYTPSIPSLLARWSTNAGTFTSPHIADGNMYRYQVPRPTGRSEAKRYGDRGCALSHQEQIRLPQGSSHQDGKLNISSRATTYYTQPSINVSGDVHGAKSCGRHVGCGSQVSTAK